MAERLPRCVHVNDPSGVGSALVRGLRRRAVDVALVQPAVRPLHGAGAPRRSLRANAAVFTVDRARLGLRLRRSLPADALVHVHYGMFGPIGVWSGRRYILHFHGSDLLRDDRRPALHAVHRLCARRAHRCLVSTPDLLRYADRLGVDLEFLPNPVAEPDGSAGDGGVAAHDVFFASKLDRTKGAPAFLPAALALARDGLSVGLLGFGNAAAPSRELVRAIAAAGGTVYAERLARGEFQALIGRAGVVVGQLAVGALGMTELDALVRGRPLVCRFTYAGAYPTAPPVVHAGDAGSIRAAVGRLHRDPVERARVGRAGADWVRREHGEDHVAGRLVELYAGAAR
jgi:glycosyltransferase involved in cell wall biosynthesis